MKLKKLLKKIFSFSTEYTIALKEKHHYKKTVKGDMYSNPYEYSYSYKLNLEVKDWLDENSIQSHWRPDKEKNLIIYFKTAEDAVRFRLVWG
jgi:hypothetical protein